MNLLAFLKHESHESWKLILAMATLSGVANGALLAIINLGADVSGAENSSDFEKPNLLLLFAVAMAIFVYSKRFSLVLSTKVVENMMRNARIRICDKIRKSDLPTVERLDKSAAYTRISQDTSTVSQSAFVIIVAGQEAIMLGFALLYLAWLSVAAFLVTVSGAALALYVYRYHTQAVHEELRTVANKEAELLNSLGHIFYGFKELRLNQSKSDSLFGALTEIADATRDAKSRAGVLFATSILFSQIFFYTLMAAVVFVLPQYVPMLSGTITKMTSAILFIIGPMTMVVGAGPTLARADVALDSLYTLERRIDQSQSARGATGGPPLPSFEHFRRIVLGDVTFAYLDPEGAPLFTVGPLRLKVNRGEIIFIVGGNGSGKSTFLKLLTGLYLPSSGNITVDDRDLNATNAQGYRELFAAIFTDFHLFDRLYGMEDVSEGRVVELIREMELEEKVRFEGNHFSTLELSTGQRKRLALIIALLEDKSIYVFDEWAADQDQHFRKRFYEEILLNLKSQGKTILAATHDDQYWHVADRVVKLDLGRIVSDAPYPSRADG